MYFRKTLDLNEQRRICDQLATHHPSLKGLELFAQSIRHFLGSPEYHFVTVDGYAWGIVKEYREPFNEWDLFGVEALLFLDDNLDLHLDILWALRNAAAQEGKKGLCISPRSLSHLRSLEWLARRHGTTIDQLPQMSMQGAVAGVYSAFTDNPGANAFFSRCLPLTTQEERQDFNGVVTSSTEPLYRGEGRIDKFGCSDLASLCRHIMEQGFSARKEGLFDGTLQSQLRHQGYVDQPTVSLSESFEAAAYYATAKHSRTSGAVVFVIDRPRLSKIGAVYDAVASLKKNLPWMLGGSYELIKRIMAALDAGHDDVRASGAFLQKCNEECRIRVEEFGGGSLGPRINWSKLLGADSLALLGSSGIGVNELDQISSEFESFWLVALGKMATMETVSMDGRSAESTDLSRGYFRAFADVEEDLKRAWKQNETSGYNHPGWDLSPLGYVAKSIRDREFFAPGSVPGDCVVDAIMVDQYGRGASGKS